MQLWVLFCVEFKKSVKSKKKGYEMSRIIIISKICLREILESAETYYVKQSQNKWIRNDDGIRNNLKQI